MPVVLIDTNVWVSAFINPHGYPAQLRQAWLDGQFQPVVSITLLDELADVLSRPRIAQKYGITPEAVTGFLQLLAERAVQVTLAGTFHECRDPDDNAILETAVLGAAQYAVSRDEDLTRDLDLVERLKSHGVEVLTVQQFVARLAADLPRG